MKKRTLTKGMLMAALICGCVQWGGTAVHAEELQEFTLDPMIVTAQRMETRDLDTPASVNVITEAEIKDAGYEGFDLEEVNDEIDRLRHSATCSLFERKDVIIVASVSCIYRTSEIQ